MKIVSIDIETTGIDPNVCQVVQLGAVLFDTNQSFKPQFYSKIVLQDEYVGEEFAINMNKKLIEMANLYKQNPIAEYSNCFVHINDLAKDFRKWLNTHRAFGGQKSINVAGKNVAGFDMQFLMKVPEWAKRVPWKRRVLDPAVLCYSKNDICLPDLHTCMERTFMEFCQKDTAHLGDSDALDVAGLLYVKLNGNKANQMVYVGRLIEKLSKQIEQKQQEMYDNLWHIAGIGHNKPNNGICINKS